MPSAYSSEDFPFTVEDWADPNHMEIIALCRSVDLAIGAWKEMMREHPDRKLVVRWNRGWTCRHWERDPWKRKKAPPEGQIR